MHSFIVVMSVPMGVLNVKACAMIGDCLDCMEWGTGFRDPALGSACQTFANKPGNALAAAGIVLMYMAIHLDPGQMLNSTTVTSALEMAVSDRMVMFSLITAVPGISLALCIIPLFFYDLTGEKKRKITGEIAG
jgi:Na+/melibiose symporter-like transporter